MTQRLYLLRHGEVTSHRGDVPVTEEGLQTAMAVGRRLAAGADGVMRVVSGETRRTRETAAALARGARETGAHVVEDGVAFALRNPDLYLAGVRVDMVSSAAAFAAQVPGVDEPDIRQLPFFAEWLAAADRIGWWLRHKNPPGDDAAAVAARIRTFAASLTDRKDDQSVTVGITHSPVLRAVTLDATGSDTGEPAWLAGLAAEVSPDRSTLFRVLQETP